MAEDNHAALGQLVEMGIPPGDALACLKACNNDIGRAAEYYYSGDLENARANNGWDDSVWSSDRWAQEIQQPTPAVLHAPQPQSNFAIHHVPDSLSVNPTVAASRPPSRAMRTDGMEDPDLARALEESLQDSQAGKQMSTLLPQQSGITSGYTPGTNFQPAQREYYPEQNWAMTTIGADAKAVEIVLDPLPLERKRGKGEPAFIRHGPNVCGLGGLLTILHSIPEAREELLQRHHVLNEYGHNDQWWRGQVIQLPKIVNLEDETPSEDAHLDVITETQRLMAFLDHTERTYGSCESLATQDNIFSLNDSNDVIITNFFTALNKENEQVQNENKYPSAMASRAIRINPGIDNDITTTPFSCLDLSILRPLIDGNGDLYDAIDALVWEEDSDDIEVYLDHIGHVFTMQLRRDERKEDELGCGIDIPPEIYLERYTAAYKEPILAMKKERDALVSKIHDIEKKEMRLKQFHTVDNQGKNVAHDIVKLIEATTEHFQQPWPSTVDENGNDIHMTMPDITPQLTQIIARIKQKLEDLQVRKEEARKAVTALKSLLTSPDKAPEGSKLRKLTLRGICPDPSTVYIQKRPSLAPLIETQSENSKEQKPQWWSMKFDMQAKRWDEDQTGKSEVKRVEQELVLRAAKSEGKGSLILVYATDDVDKIYDLPLPEPLLKFVEQDNNDFRQEITTNPEDRTVSGYEWWNGVNVKKDSGINNVSRSSFGSFQATPGNSRRNSFSEDVAMDSTETLMPMPDLPPPPPPESSFTDLEMRDVSQTSTGLSSSSLNSNSDSNTEAIARVSEKPYQAQALIEHVEHADNTASDASVNRQRMDLES